MGFRFHISLLLAAFVFVGCTTTKDRWVNRKYHETTAHYNAFFNGQEALMESLEQFEKSEEYNFEELYPCIIGQTKSKRHSCLPKWIVPLRKAPR